MMFRIGIISDTHGALRPEAERRLAGVDHIVHAGDIERPESIGALCKIAPVTAIRGNVDTGDWAREYPETKLASLAKIDLRSARPEGASNLCRRWLRRGPLRAFPRTEDRHRRRRSLSQSRQRRAAALQPTHHAGNT